jgi:hypothetical protein
VIVPHVLLLAATSAAVPAPVASPVASIDLGFVAGLGGQGTREYSRALGTWYRLGPELVASLYVAPKFTIGMGVGYQAGYYSAGIDGTTFRRHEYSSRLVFRYHAVEDANVEHAVGGGVAIINSRVGADGPSVPDYSSVTRIAAFVTYGPCFRISEHFHVTTDLSLAAGPPLSEPSLEASARVGIQYRF